MNYKLSFSLLVATALPSLTVPTVEAAGEIEKSLLDTHPNEAGFVSIFNGKDLTGWDGHPKLWSVKDGAITGQTTPENPAKNNTFLIWTNGTVSDFELRCSFKLVPNNPQGFANSGIQYRSKVLDPSYWVVGGYQADMEAGPTYTGILYEERMTRAIMAACGEKVVWDNECKKQVVGTLGKAEDLQATVKRGDWNDYVVLAQGNHLQQWVNGHQTVDVLDDCESKRAMSGVLALQMHAGQPFTVQFQNLRLKSLPAGANAADGDLKPLQGLWRVSSMEANGAATPSEDITNTLLTIKGTNYTVKGETFTDQGSFIVNASKSPKEMDIYPDSAQADGGALPAIYEVGPDTMRVCYGRRGDRPASFGAGRMLITYKRQ